MAALIDPLKFSQFLPALRAAERLTFRVRRLDKVEIAQLEAQGCECEDWARVQVAESFRPDRVREVRFRGDVVLGRCFGKVRLDGWEESSAIIRATLVDCRIDDGVVIRDVGILDRMHVGNGAALIGCGSIVHPEGGNFGIGASIAIVETGGRVTRSYPEMTVDDAARTLLPRGNTRALAAFLRRVEVYSARARSKFGVIGSDSRVLSTPRISNVFLGSGARIESACSVTDSVLFCDSLNPAVIEQGSLVECSMLQHGARVSTMGLVAGSVLCEHSTVERQAKISSSVIGPNSVIAQGEVSSSLVGPFVGMHHQSLLISVAWPEGKGNLGAGCLCGSNHTGRSPDQEFWPGEGLFLGLGVKVKFPGCFRDAPYTLVATGVTLPPQSVSLPFSLILEPSELPAELAAGTNEILPAWVLGHNLFAIRRAEKKFRDRDRTSGDRLETRVFRTEMVQRMISARAALQSISGKNHYSENDLPALGKSFLNEENRLRAIEDYGFQIQYFALESIARRFLADGRIRKSVLARTSRSEDWEFVRSILRTEELGTDPKALVRLYLERYRVSIDSVEESKARDDIRGMRIIPDYADHHILAAENPFILDLRKEYEGVEDALENLLEAAPDA